VGAVIDRHAAKEELAEFPGAEGLLADLEALVDAGHTRRGNARTRARE
jgi:hypothetical protein